MVAKEVGPPEGIEAICWRLWTTVEIGGAILAAEVIGWYARRWMIEGLHRILKSGCKVEERQLESVEKLSLVLALDLIIASHLLGLTKTARESPGQAASDGSDEINGRRSIVTRMKLTKCRWKSHY